MVSSSLCRYCTHVHELTHRQIHTAQHNKTEEQLFLVLKANMKESRYPTHKHLCTNTHMNSGEAPGTHTLGKQEPNPTGKDYQQGLRSCTVCLQAARPPVLLYPRPKPPVVTWNGSSGVTRSAAASAAGDW